MIIDEIDDELISQGTVDGSSSKHVQHTAQCDLEKAERKPGREKEHDPHAGKQMESHVRQATTQATVTAMKLTAESAETPLKKANSIHH